MTKLKTKLVIYNENTLGFITPEQPSLVPPSHCNSIGDFENKVHIKK